MSETKKKNYLQAVSLVVAIAGGVIAIFFGNSLYYLYEEQSTARLESQLSALIDQEASAVVNKDLGQINEIFDHDAVIIHAGVKQWAGSDRIKKRYSDMFKSQRYNRYSHTAKQISISGDSAVIIADTTGEYELDGVTKVVWSDEGEKWTLKNTRDGWKVVRFVYGRDRTD